MSDNNYRIERPDLEGTVGTEFGINKPDTEKPETNVQEKRASQLKYVWVQNVVRIQGITKEEAEILYDKIKPHG